MYSLGRLDDNYSAQVILNWRALHTRTHIQVIAVRPISDHAGYSYGRLNCQRGWPQNLWIESLNEGTHPVADETQQAEKAAQASMFAFDSTLLHDTRG